MGGLHRETQQLLELDAREDQRAHASEIIFNDRLAEVILVGAVATETKSCDRTALDQRDLSAVVRCDELIDDSLLALENGRDVAGRRNDFIQLEQRRSAQPYRAIPLCGSILAPDKLVAESRGFRVRHAHGPLQWRRTLLFPSSGFALNMSENHSGSFRLNRRIATTPAGCPVSI